MSFFKEVFKKLLIAAVSGALILGFVYFKDNYMEEGNSDMEELQAVSIEKEPKKEPEKKVVESTPKVVEQKEATKLVLEVEAPQEDEPEIVQNDPKTTLAKNDKVYNSTKKNIEDQSFEDFKNSMSLNSKDGFDELERELNN